MFSLVKIMYIQDLYIVKLIPKGALCAILHYVLRVCDVAPSPTRARGHVAERRAAAPHSPRRPAGAPMHIRAVIRSCVMGFDFHRAVYLWSGCGIDG